MNAEHDKKWLVARRDFLKSSAALGVAAAYGLAPTQGLAQGVPLQFDGSKFMLKPAEANAKRGGVLRICVLSRQPHFDVHQSGTFANISTQACMFDNLIRRDPRDSGKSIIPDLAHSWEIKPDGTSYTFFLRQGVQFHDGAELTAEDVKATFDRIAKPPSGIAIPRSSLFRAVEEIRARDKYTVEFKLAEARPINFIMSAIASGWNVIVRKKVLEDNNYNLRRVNTLSGTGPFVSLKRVENEVWTFERNKNYWNKDLPLLDGLEVYHALPFSPEMASALLSNRVDYVRVTDPATMKRVAQTPGMSGAQYYQSVIHAVWPNNKKKPFDDPRVRRAMHLVLDRPVLVEVAKDLAPTMVGGFIYPFSEFATPKDELEKRVGYQPDPAAAIKEARALLQAAGGGQGLKGLDLLVRDLPNTKLWAQAVQGMLKETLDYRDEIAHRAGVDLVRRRQVRQLRHPVRGHRLVPARPVRLFPRLVQRRRPAKPRLLEQPEVRGDAPEDRPRSGCHEAARPHPRGREAHGGRSAPAADGLGEDQRRLVQLREGPETAGVFRPL